MWARLERANEHLSALVEQSRIYFDADPHQYTTEADLEGGTYVVRVTIRQPPPIGLAILCGDFIQSLRTSLDYLTNALVPDPTGKTQFPIYSQRDDFEQRVLIPAQRGRNGPLTGLDVNGEAFNRIVSYQPFNRSTHQDALTNHPLYQLSELSNMDKHRTILTRAASHRIDPTGAAPDITFSGRNVNYVGQAVYRYDKALEDGDEFLSGNFRVTGPNPELRISGNLLTDVAFGIDLVTTDGLEAIRRAVWGICNTLTTM